MRLSATKLGIIDKPKFIPHPANALTNWKGTGTGGTGGLPTGWSSGTVAGVTFSFIKTPYKNGNMLEILFDGVSSASGNLSLTINSSVILPVVPGDQVAQEIFAEALETPLPSPLLMQGQWRTSVPAFLSTMDSANLTNTFGQKTIEPSSLAPASAAFAGFFLIKTIGSGVTVRLRYKIFAPQLYKLPA